MVCHLATPGNALLLPDFAHVSLRLVKEVPDATQVADRVVGMMDRVGMGKVGSRFVIILEPDRAFDVTEMAEICASSQSAPDAQATPEPLAAY